ncbi:MAG: precorrin-2 C(20)-methyltransferase [Clostridia bacterium]|nr:precorrin-2 C(20)-methyltransferase [Clostridia bacterium]
MKGIAYGVGVGPGDPELLTLKAIKIIRENDVIAVAGSDARGSVAYKIASAVIPEMENKTILSLHMPMIRDRNALSIEHEKCAKQIESFLDMGKNVVYITLGDPTVYCTFSYLQHFLERDGYEVELISGIPSFCAAAARLNTPLCEWDEPLRIIPAVHVEAADMLSSDNCVIMKSASRMKEVKQILEASGRTVKAVENCGMKDERVFLSADEIPDEAGYFSLIIVK